MSAPYAERRDFSDLKVGDMVGVIRGLHHSYSECEVVRLTPTQVVVNVSIVHGGSAEINFRKKNGQAVSGGHSYFSYAPTLVAICAERRATQTLRDSRADLKQRLESLRLDLLTQGDVDALAAAVRCARLATQTNAATGKVTS